MTSIATEHFDRQYQTHLKHLTLKGLQPKTIEAYARANRRIGERFDHRIDTLSEQQLLDYFTELVAGVALVEFGQAGSVWLEVLLPARLVPALGDAQPDQAAEKPALTRHCHG